jgi:hypothetical protein
MVSEFARERLAEVVRQFEIWIDADQRRCRARVPPAPGTHGQPPVSRPSQTAVRNDVFCPVQMLPSMPRL